MTVDLRLGDCVDVMATLPENSVDSIVCDPPYGLEFMGKEWDKLEMRGTAPVLHGGLGRYAPGEKRPGYASVNPTAMQHWHYRWATAALRVAKPGAILMAFGGTRTVHRLACAIEDAGWEIRDTMMWLYGSGFPKSRDISKAIDKAAGATREVIGVSSRHGGGAKVFENQGGTGFATNGKPDITAPATSLARDWQGWGTALKPAYEPVILAMKPLDDTYAQNAEKWGVAGLWIEGSRIATTDCLNGGAFGGCFGNGKPTIDKPIGTGRWPANLVLDEDAAALLDEQSGVTMSRKNRLSDGRQNAGNSIFLDGRHDAHNSHTDTGGASRFFYCAKASRREREMGLEGMEKQMQLRDDLTPEQRAYVTSELERCGVRL